MSRRRSLTEEERTLWSGVARSIKPLRRSRRAAKPPAVEEVAGENSGEQPREAAPISAHVAALHAEPAPAKQTPPLAPLGRRLKKRVARGREAIDDRLDLHGYTLSQAHAALLEFLRRAQADGGKIVLVVTGKGTGGGTDRPTRANAAYSTAGADLWLLPEFRALVVGFEDAHIGHGGQGALYVRLRRRAKSRLNLNRSWNVGRESSKRSTFVGKNGVLVGSTASCPKPPKPIRNRSRTPRCRGPPTNEPSRKSRNGWP